MKRNGKGTLFSMFLIFFITLLMNMNYNAEYNHQGNVIDVLSPPEKEFNLKSSATDPIIHVTGANWTWTVGNGTATGTGTWGDPYIIQDKIIDVNGNDYGIRIDSSDNYYFRIENCTVYNASSAGLLLSNANNGTITNCNISFNQDQGIWVSSSDFNNFTYNTFNNNSDYGIILASAKNNTIFKNEINFNGRDGIYTGQGTVGNLIQENNVKNNTNYGMRLYGHTTDWNKVIGNNVSGSSSAGIFIREFDNGILSKNYLRNNQIGLIIGNYLTGCSNNIIYNNYFIGNVLHAKDDFAGNDWSYNRVGNYWDNYSGSDSAPYDGVGNTAYTFIEGSAMSQDDYPILNLSSYQGEVIHIDESRTNAINWSRAAELKDWVSGSGSYNDPYTIQDLTIDGQGTSTCIKIEESSAFFLIENCTITNAGVSEYAIYLTETDNGTVKNNKIYNNAEDGIYIFNNCGNNTIIGNEVNTTAGHGIFLSGVSTYNKILNNSIHNNTGDSKSSIHVQSSGKNTISGNSIFNNSGNSREGIMIRSTSYNNTMYNNTIEFNDGNGIKIEWDSHFNVVFKNHILNNTGNGFSLIGTMASNGCDFNNMSSNMIHGNSLNGIIFDGLFDRHYNNIIEKNNISYNGQHGIRLSWSQDNTIIGNNISFNGQSGSYQGINITIANDNIFTQNLINNHTGGGFYTSVSASSNLIYNNSFVGNIFHAMDNQTSGSFNDWNNSVIGNYWDDYTGIDIDDDKKGDTPYDISGSANRQDLLPIWDDGDDLNPEITINLPLNNTKWSSQPLINVSVVDQTLHYIWYNVSNNPTIEFLTNNTNENLNDSLWSGLPEGQFQLQIHANDTAGHSSSLLLTLYKDTHAPNISISIVINGSHYNSPSYIRVDAQELNLDKIWYNITGNSTKIFLNDGVSEYLDSWLWMNLPEGQFQVSFYANDTLGQLNGTIIFTLFKDTIIPSVSINEFIYGGGSIAPVFNVSISDGNLEYMWYSVDGGITKYYITQINGSIDQDLWASLSGDVTVTFYARDKAGNVGTTQVTVTIPATTPLATTLATTPPGIDPLLLIFIIGAV